MQEKIITIAKRRFANAALTAEYGPGARMVATAQASLCGQNAHPYFSVTAEISTTESRRHHDCDACGCLHDQVARHWPAVAPIIALHLANADTGEPMHAEGNGWYWLAGYHGGLGERYHGGKDDRGRSPDDCLSIFARHVRLPLAEARIIADRIQTRDDWRRERKAMWARWREEAAAGLALIAQLAQPAAIA